MGPGIDISHIEIITIEGILYFQIDMTQEGKHLGRTFIKVTDFYEKVTVEKK